MVCSPFTPYLPGFTLLNIGSIATVMANLLGLVRMRYPPFLAPFDRHVSPNQVTMAGYTGSHILSLTVDT
jgi:hypothetical protein